MKQREDSGPGQLPIAVTENLSAPDPLIERLDCASQEREGRPRGIQNLKPAAESARICYAIGIFHRRRRCFPTTALDKVAPQRLTAGDQAVMAVRQREHGQEGNRRATTIADAAPDFDPVMVFVMSLFLSTTMTHHGILQTTRAATHDRFCASLCPIGLQLALRRGK